MKRALVTCTKWYRNAEFIRIVPCFEVQSLKNS